MRNLYTHIVLCIIMSEADTIIITPALYFYISRKHALSIQHVLNAILVLYLILH